jgi:hypothetical protein
MKADLGGGAAGLNYIPKKRSRKRGFGVRWKEQNEIYDITEIKENIEGATKSKVESPISKPLQGSPAAQTSPKANTSPH